MHVTRLFRLFALLLALALLVACGGDAPDAATPADAEPAAEAAATSAPAPAEPVAEATAADPTAEPTREPTKEPTQEPTSEPATADTGAAEAATTTATGDTTPGWACFGTAGAGLTCLTPDGAWQTFTSDASPLGSDYITAMTTCPDGSILIAHTGGLSRFDGTNWQEYDSGWGFGSADGIACGADDRFWVAHFEGVSTFDGSSWTTFGSDQLATGEQATDLVDGVVIAPDSTVWVVTANTIAAYDGSAWTRWQTGEGLDDRFFFETITLDATGAPVAAHGSGLLRFDGSAWQSIENDDLYTLTAVAAGLDGTLYAGTFSQGIGATDGAAWTEFSRATGDLESDRIKALAIDGNGRLWAGSEWGLHVRSDAGWQVYRMDNADLADHAVSSIAVVAGGPALPEPAPKAPGGLTGTLTKDGTPVADTLVELCVESLSSFFSGDTPCSDQPFFTSATTDAAGAFAFSDLPAGLYVITVQTADGWAQLTTEFGLGSERVPVLAGETLDIGELILTDEE